MLQTTSKNSGYDDDEQLSYNSDTYSSGTPISANASSELAEQGDNTYLAENAIDGDESTAWVEGVDGDGEGEWISVTFDNQDSITAIRISNGYQKSDDVFQKNGRVKDAKIQFEDGSIEEFTLFDHGYGDQIVFLSSPKDGNSIVLTIESVYPGTDYSDTCISEIGLARGDVVYPSSISMIYSEPITDSTSNDNRTYDEDFSIRNINSDEDAEEYVRQYLNSIGTTNDISVSCDDYYDGGYQVSVDGEDYRTWKVTRRGFIFDNNDYEWVLNPIDDLDLFDETEWEWTRNGITYELIFHQDGEYSVSYNNSGQEIMDADAGIFNYDNGVLTMTGRFGGDDEVNNEQYEEFSVNGFSGYDSNNWIVLMY